MVGWLYGYMVGWLHGWIYMVGWLDGWMVTWLDGYMVMPFRHIVPFDTDMLSLVKHLLILVCVLLFLPHRKPR